MENENYKIAPMEKIGFMAFSTSTNIAFNFKSLYYLIFLSVVLDLGDSLAGIIVALGTVWDAINDPLIAVFCTNHKFKNGEKIRPWALWACVPWAISLVLIFVNFGFESKALTMIVALLAYFIFEALYTFLCMPYNSMASLATKDDHERASINAFRGVGGCIGSGIGAVAIPSLMKLFGGFKESDTLTPSDSNAIFIVACILGGLCIIGSLIHYFTSKERIKEDENAKEEKIGLFKAYKMLFKCKSWLFNMIYIIGYAFIQVFVINNVEYYCQYIIKDTLASTPILAFYLVVAIITSFIAPMLDKKIGRKKLSIVSIIVVVVGLIPFLIDPYSIITIYILSSAMGFGLTATFVIFNTNRNSCADILEVQNGVRIDSLVAGGDNLITKLAEAGAVLIMTQVYGLVDLESVAGPDTIIFFLGWGSLITSILMTFFALKINPKKELEEEKKKKGIL